MGSTVAQPISSDPSSTAGRIFIWRPLAENDDILLAGPGPVTVYPVTDFIDATE
jgi:hypothetical protein